ncbi:MAG: alpha/beta hydrolase [Parvularculaceae bacterium]
MLLLPGLLCDQTVWRAQAERFSRDHNVIIPDYGDADSIGDMAERALALAPGRFALAGHSMGARVAIELARRAPQRVERLAILDTGVHGVSEREREKRKAFLKIADEEGMDALCDAWLPPMVHPARRHDDAFMAPLRAMVTRFTPQRFAAQINALLNRPDAAAAVATIECPLLIGVGRQDEWSPVEQHEDILRITGRGGFVIFEDCGHMAPCEAPEAVNDALSAWLGGARDEERNRGQG